MSVIMQKKFYKKWKVVIFENNDVVVKDVTNGGVIVYVEDVRGFIPASKLSLNYVDEEELANYVHQSMEVRVINVDAENKRLVLSAREILKEIADAERAKKVSNVEVGLVTEGVVESLQPYGAFVNLGNGLSGLLHISQICQNRIKHPGVVLKEGQEVTVKIISTANNKISLSMKELIEEQAEAESHETYDYKEEGQASTGLGALLKGLKLN